MRRIVPGIVMLAVCACTGDPAGVIVRSSKIPAEERPADWEHLVALTDGRVREGVLVADDIGFELHFRRGDSTRPFLWLDPPGDDADCWREPLEDEVDDDAEEETVRESSWWLFHDADETVALEFTADDVGAWFWNARRECAVRRPAIVDLEVNDVTPPEYYKADDVQVGYRWNYTYQEETGPVLQESDGDRAIDLEVVDGPERLVAERDAVSILAADGRALLHETFEWSPQQPCYDSQLSIFEEPDGGLYAVISWESFGTPTSCEQTAGGNRYQSAIAEWRSPREGFVTTYRIDDSTQPLEPKGESVSKAIDLRHETLGGELVIEMRSAARHQDGRVQRCAERERGSGDCLSYESCWRWQSSRRRQTTYRFEAADGPTLPLGSGLAAHSELVHDCAPVSP